MFGTMLPRRPAGNGRNGTVCSTAYRKGCDAYAKHRMQMAVSEFEQRRAKRVISQMRRSAAR